MAASHAVEQPLAIHAVGLTKTFKDFWGRPKAKAVNDVDFEVRPGEIVGLLGPNGSGKSTTVKMILGLLYPTAGALSVLGKSPQDVATKRMIGYLPEETYLYKYLTAYETLDFFGSLFNLPGAVRRERTAQLLEMVGLTHARSRQVGEFSKGMARRIGLAQAMINDPDLIILDEPTSGLDPLGCREVKDLISFFKSRGKTILVCSHLLADIEDICDRVIIMYGGKVRAVGTLGELLTLPDESRIKTPLLPTETMEKLLKILRENLKDGEFVVDKPRMSLEEFFLNVVKKAREESVETSGASGGGEIAKYLIQGGDGAEKRIESILHPAVQVQSPTPVQDTQEVAGAREREVEGRLPLAPPLPQPPTAQSKATLQKAEDKLNGILGGGRGGA